MSNENAPPAATQPDVGHMAFATQVLGGGCGGGGAPDPAAPPPALAPPRPSLPMSQDFELLMTQPEVEVVDYRLVGHGRRAQVRGCEGGESARKTRLSLHLDRF